jgi:glucose-6-phosphate 1-dehydrogenase
MAAKLDNFSMIIFGAGGDLTSRKLIPAIYKLVKLGSIPADFRLIGVDQLEYDHETFREAIKNKVKTLSLETVDRDFENFCRQHLLYVKGTFEDETTYSLLDQQIKEIEDKKGMCDNLLYYLATPPSAAPLIIKGLALVGLNGKAKECQGWRKIIIEKPFGSDFSSAKKLNEIVDKAFMEEQIYRIDHYLAKETVQNILVFRFGNGMFEPLWNSQYIDRVEITIAEDFGVMHRGAYYEQAGLIRDIVQNHGLQLLAMIAMEAPQSLKADAIRNEKVKIFKAIKRGNPSETLKNVVIGQYEGYRQEENVSPQSEVETFAAIKFLIENRRWNKVPFFVRAGKNLARELTEIIIHFKHPTHEFFGHAGMHAEANQIIIQIQPEEKISILFGAKRPGEEIVMDPVYMEFNYKKSFLQKEITPYHLLILQAIEGDQTRFIRKDGVEECWKIIDKIKDSLKGMRPIVYPIKSWGPEESNKLLERDGFAWRLK